MLITNPAQRRSFATPRTIFAMMLREMVTTYGRSPGGYIWAVIEPVAAIALLSFAFSLAFRAPALGVNFPLFYATAYLPYMLFHDVSNKVAVSIRFSRPLLAYPAVTLVDAIIARFVLNTLTHIMVFYIVIFGTLQIFDTQVVIDLARIADAVAMAAALAIGIGTLNCYLMAAFPAWERLWQVITRPLFIISGVFFLFEDVPAEYRDYLWFNPLFHVTGQMRTGFYATYDASYVSHWFVYTVAFSTLAAGLLILRRQQSVLLSK